MRKCKVCEATETDAEFYADSSECVKLLRQFNEWRRFDGEIDEDGPAMPHPKSIGFAIDMAIRLIEERGELLAALEDIAQWTERYTQPGHPISTVARRAIASAKGGA